MSLKKEDLIQTCPNCNGEGEIHTPPRDSQSHTFGQQRMGFSRTESCSRCWQTGEILTDEGEAILSVIKLAKRQNGF